MKFERRLARVAALAFLISIIAGCSQSRGPAAPSDEKLRPAEDAVKKRDAEMAAKAKTKMDSGR